MLCHMDEGNCWESRLGDRLDIPATELLCDFVVPTNDGLQVHGKKRLKPLFASHRRVATILRD